MLQTMHLYSLVIIRELKII